jgi:hypothetical protein
VCSFVAFCCEYFQAYREQGTPVTRGNPGDHGKNTPISQRGIQLNV